MKVYPFATPWWALLLLTTAAPSAAEEPVSSGQGAPELRPRATLIAIIHALDAVLPDPRSITDVVLCPPQNIKYAKDGSGRPIAWYVAFSLNSKTADGGFSGRTIYGASFKVGRNPKIYKTQMADDEGLNMLINNATRKQMKDCPAVSNAQLGELLGATDRRTIDVSK